MNTPSAARNFAPTRFRIARNLIQVLGIASELEHNLMCQYLFAAYSLKRYPDEGLTEAQLDQARGWGSLITMVARQEMEHLGLVMNLRSAIGAPPSFSRPNFPQPADALRQGRYRFRSHALQPRNHRAIPEVRAAAPAPARFLLDDGSTRRGAIASTPLHCGSRRRRFRGLRSNPSTSSSIPYRISTSRCAARFAIFPTCSSDLPKHRFSAARAAHTRASWTTCNQYDVDLVRVTDRDSALKAIHIILEQGEGIQAPPDYVEHTHYCSFTRILNEMRDAGFDAARPVVDNPLTTLHMDITTPGEVNLITNPDTLQVAVLFNRCYELMLVLLLYLYGSRGRYPQRSLEFTNAIFFPLMTMFVRPLAEMLTQLPAFADRPGNAGPGFELPNEIVVFPDYRYLWNSIDNHFRTIADDFGQLNILRQPHDHPPAIVERLRYTGENMQRLALDWHSHWADVGYTIPV